MSSENNNNNKCWNITDNIINNANCICEMCTETV